jgi:hypothetical protein
MKHSGAAVHPVFFYDGLVVALCVAGPRFWAMDASHHEKRISHGVRATPRKQKA